MRSLGARCGAQQPVSICTPRCWQEIGQDGLSRTPPNRLDSPRLPPLSAPSPRGAVAQLVERFVRNEEVSGSIPLSSTSPCHHKGSGLLRPVFITKTQPIACFWQGSSGLCSSLLMQFQPIAHELSEGQPNNLNCNSSGVYCSKVQPVTHAALQLWTDKKIQLRFSSDNKNYLTGRLKCRSFA